MSRDAGSAGQLHGVEQVVDERPDARVDRLDRRAGRAQHRVAVEADLADGHRAPPFATAAERAWIREVLREHLAEWFPDVQAP